jgi:hypothetical protein
MSWCWPGYGAAELVRESVGQSDNGGAVRKFLVLIGLLLLVAVSASANPVDASFLGYQYGNWQAGFPYYAYIQGFGVTQVMCDDYEHGGVPGFSWLGNLTVLGTKDLSLTRFNQMPDALTLYEEAGWLLLQTQVNGPNQWKDQNYAVWHIFDSNSPLDAGAKAWLDAAVVEAGKGFPGINFNLVDIITPVNQYDPNPLSMQEFLFINTGIGPTSPLPPPNPTPEPGTLALLGTGALAVLGRKLRW